MAVDGTQVALNLVNVEINKAMTATAMLMIKCAKQEGMDTVQYTRIFQQQYIRDNQEILDPVLEQSFLSQCQDQVLDRLRRAIPACDRPTSSRHNSETRDSLDWWDQLTMSPCLTTKCNDDLTPLNTSAKTIFNWEMCAEKNIKFIQSIRRIQEESERNKLIPTSMLQSLLHDDNECFSQPQQEVESNKKFSEDSGIVCNDRFTEDSCSVNFISRGVMKYTLQDANANQLLLNSLSCVINFVKNKLKEKPTEVFFNFKNSVVEHACNTVSGCFGDDGDCREMITNFVQDVLEDAWSNRSYTHREREFLICFGQELINKTDICYSILEYISEKMDYVGACLRNKNSEAPAMVEKLYYFLNLYNNVCETLRNLKAKHPGTEKKAVVNSETCDVSKLWQDKWCAKDTEENDTGKFEEWQTLILERLIMKTTVRYPLIATVAMQALHSVTQINSVQELTNDDWWEELT